MDIGSPRRPLPSNFKFRDPLDEERREQCSLCCGARAAAIVGLSTAVLCTPFNILTFGLTCGLRDFDTRAGVKNVSAASKFATITMTVDEMYAIRKQRQSVAVNPNATVRPSVAALEKPATMSTSHLTSFQLYFKKFRFASRWVADRYLFQCLPVTALCFTHHVIFSELMWSRSEKSAFSCATQTIAINGGLWAAILFTSAMLYRRVLPRYSTYFRLQAFEFSRVQRLEGRKVFSPRVTGLVSAHMGVTQFLWTFAGLNTMWMLIVGILELSSVGGHYSYLTEAVPSLSQTCFPRWRDWRDKQIKEHKLKSKELLVVREMGQQKSTAVKGVMRHFTKPTID